MPSDAAGIELLPNRVLRSNALAMPPSMPSDAAGIELLPNRVLRSDALGVSALKF